MSFNRVGLQTPRGTGTNGYVKKNIRSVKDTHKEDSSTGQYDRRQQMQRIANEKNANSSNNIEKKKKLGVKIMDHEKRREIDRRCMELREYLEEEEDEDAVIEFKVAELRNKLITDFEAGIDISKYARIKRKSLFDDSS